MAKTQDYTAQIVWTGDRGEGTRQYRGYDRAWRIVTPGKPPVECSNDPLLGGDPAKANPEDLLLASLAGCHMLWYLDLCSGAGVMVIAYEDHAEARMVEDDSKGGHFVSVVLRPEVTITSASDPVDNRSSASTRSRLTRFSFCVAARP